MKKIFKINYSGLLKGLTLFVLSVILTAFFTALSLIITPLSYLITFRWQKGFNAIGEYFNRLALSIGVFANVSCYKVLNLLITRGDAMKFGEIDDTISYVIARNYYRNKLTLFGRLIAWLLNTIEKDHLSNAINDKIACDQDATIRLNDYKYYE